MEQMLRAIDADHRFDHSTEDLASSGQTSDVIFDSVARSSDSACIKAYPIEQATAAHTRVETEPSLGIVVISMKNDESNGMSGEKE